MAIHLWKLGTHWPSDQNFVICKTIMKNAAPLRRSLWNVLQRTNILLFRELSFSFLYQVLDSLNLNKYTGKIHIFQAKPQQKTQTTSVLRLLSFLSLLFDDCRRWCRFSTFARTPTKSKESSEPSDPSDGCWRTVRADKFGFDRDTNVSEETEGRTKYSMFLSIPE